MSRQHTKETKTDARQQAPKVTRADSPTAAKAGDDASLPRIQIVNREHPHFEEYGRFTGKMITMKFGDGKSMAEVKLEHCRHGGDGCFVSMGDVKRVAER